MRELRTSNFRVRQYECDALGHLNNANYLRYAQESALDAFQQLGLDQARLASFGISLQPRNVYIEFLRPFKYGDQVSVQTTTSELGEDKITLFFEFQKDGDEKSFAISQISYDFIETKIGQEVQAPIEILKEMSALDRWDSSSMPVETLQSLHPPQGAFSLPWRIEWRDVGSDQKFNIASYLDNLIDFVLIAAANCGWTHKRSLDEGIVWVVRRQWLKILQDAIFEDELKFTTWISEFKRSTVTRNYSIHRAHDDILIAEARTLWIALDAVSGRPRRIPEVWKHDFDSQIFTNGITQSS